MTGEARIVPTPIQMVLNAGVKRSQNRISDTPDSVEQEKPCIVRRRSHADEVEDWLSIRLITGFFPYLIASSINLAI